MKFLLHRHYNILIDKVANFCFNFLHLNTIMGQIYNGKTMTMTMTIKVNLYILNDESRHTMLSILLDHQRNLSAYTNSWVWFRWVEICHFVVCGVDWY